MLQALKPWLEDPLAAKLGQNVKYALHVFANVGIDVQGHVHDTMLQSYVLEAHKPHGLDSLAERHLGRRGLSYEDLCGKGAQQIPFGQVDIERASRIFVRRQRDVPACAPGTVAAAEATPALRDLYRRYRDASGA